MIKKSIARADYTDSASVDQSEPLQANAEPQSAIIAHVLERRELFSMIAGFLPVIGSLLGWKKSTVTYIAHVVHLLGEEPEREISHAAFASIFWPDLSEDAGKRKLSRHLAELRDDLKESNCFVIYAKEQKREENGKWFSLDTKYKVGSLYSILEQTAHIIREHDLMTLPARQRQARTREVLFDVLCGFGARRIDRAAVVAKRKTKKAARLAIAAGAQTEAYAEAFQPEPGSKREADLVPTAERLDMEFEAILNAAQRIADIRYDASYEELRELTDRAMRMLAPLTGRTEQAREQRALANAPVINRDGVSNRDRELHDEANALLDVAESLIEFLNPSGFPQERVSHDWIAPFDQIERLH